VLYLIDWSKLTPYHNDKRKSFEEFCYQVAERLYEKTGTFTLIDDSGGGDGVEFYLIMPNGDEWGWQAKFFYPSTRLKESGRKTQIKNSLKTAIKKHPKLKKWFLCTPSDLTSGEIKWFQKLEARTLQTSPNLVLEHWGDRKFNSYVSLPKFSGIRNYFFGELELDMNWFKSQVNKQISIVRASFIPELHIETQADLFVHSLLDDNVFREYLSQRKTVLRNYVDRFEEALNELQKEDYIDWKGTKRKLVAYVNQLRSSFNRLDKTLANYYDWLCSGQFDLLKTDEFSSLQNEITENIREYSKIVLDFDPSKMPYQGESSNHVYHINKVREKSLSPLSIAKEIVDFLYDVIKNSKNATLNYLSIFGKASVGKTHLACRIAKERIESDLPAVLLLGKPFSSNPPLEQQILLVLDIPRNYCWDDFVQALQSAAKAYRTKIPIIIDGLDDALSMDIWKNELQGFSCTLSALSQVALITTCRSSYRSIIWQSTEPQNVIELYNFDVDSTERAMKKYFDYYRIKCDVTSSSTEQFSDPIFLRIFCETHNPERRVDLNIYAGELTILEVFEAYLRRRNTVICSKLGRYSNTPIVQDALARIARELWKRKSRTLVLSDAVELIDSKKLADLDWSHSLTCLLLENGLLINRDSIGGQDSVFFAYNLMGGYIIAKEILDGIPSEKIEAFVKSQEFEDLLANEDYSKLHPLHEDILRCFALLLPKHCGKNLYQFTKNEIAFDCAVQVLFEMSPDSIDVPSKELITRLFGFPQNRMRLLKLSKNTMRHVGHPLNIEFWEKLLEELPMAERDLSRTENIRADESSLLEEMQKFEDTCKAGTDLTSIEVRLWLEAKYFRWALSSTVRQLRDRAARALYWYGRRFPAKLFDLTVSSLALNDPYVPERMLAAAYGVAMALHDDFQESEFREKLLPKEARSLYELMFKEKAPYATTHILSRDYARRLIEISLLHNSDVLSPTEKTRICPPFKDGGIRNWGESEEEDQDSYLNGSMPVHMDFGNYTLGSLVQNRANYDNKNLGYKKLVSNFFWRLYDLGYSHDLFSEIDREIHSYNWRLGRSGDGGKIDRYGKKYSWIAFFELAGFRQDNSLLPEFFSEWHRISYADIDPSFPEPVSTCNVVTVDFLGDRSLPLSEWIEKGENPDLSAYFVLDILEGKHGPWVLLDGYIRQHDAKAKRDLFVFPRGIFVKRNESSEIVEYLKKSGSRDRLPDVPEDYYTYAGEIPWCETFHENGLRVLRFVSGVKKKRMPVKKSARLKDGTLLSESDLLSRLLRNARVQSVNSSEDIEKMLQLEDIELVDLTVEEDREIEEEVTYAALIPARFYSWESYHSSINQAGGAMVPAKELTSFFDLCSQPQTFNLYQKNGNPSSITTQEGEPFNRNRQYLLYLRQDLLDTYLQKNDLELIWILWGEREFGPESEEELGKYSETHNSFFAFKKIAAYSVFKETFRGSGPDAKTSSKHCPLKSHTAKNRLRSLKTENVKKRMGRSALRRIILQSSRCRKQLTKKECRLHKEFGANSPNVSAC